MENQTNQAIKAGENYIAKVKKIVSFGAFIEVDGTEGLLHISQIAPVRIEKPEDVITEGLNINVTCVESEGEKIRFSMIDIAQEDETTAQKLDTAIQNGKNQRQSRPRRDDKRQGSNSRGRNDRSRGGFNKDRNSRSQRSDRPRRSDDRNDRTRSDRPRKDFGDRPQRTDRSDRPKRDFNDRPKRSFEPREDSHKHALGTARRAPRDKSKKVYSK